MIYICIYYIYKYCTFLISFCLQFIRSEIIEINMMLWCSTHIMGKHLLLRALPNRIPLLHCEMNIVNCHNEKLTFPLIYTPARQVKIAQTQLGNWLLAFIFLICIRVIEARWMTVSSFVHSVVPVCGLTIAKKWAGEKVFCLLLTNAVLIICC